MVDPNTEYQVINRSASSVTYLIPDEKIRREFAPGEMKRIKHSELEKLTYQPGGSMLIANYLLIKNVEALHTLDIGTQPEYNMEKAEIIELIKNGSLDAWLDCLDFAPFGVIELVKKLSVELPLTDTNKRRWLKQKTGFDVDAAIRHNEEVNEAELTENAPKQRRTQVAEPASDAGTGRRTRPEYKVVE